MHALIRASARALKRSGMPFETRRQNAQEIY
jgi:hypothetical protein